MKSRASLVLIELVIVLLVFSLAAMLCIQGFVWSNAASLEESQKDQALLQLQNAAEQLKSGQALPEWVFYDENWQKTQENPAFILRISPVEQENRLLATFQLTVTKADGTVLGGLTVSYQEVTP